MDMDPTTAVDSFQLCMDFHALLSKTSASTESLAKAARFAAKWSAHCDELYMALLQRLTAVTDTDAQKINLFVLLDHILLTTLRHRFTGYRDRLSLDLPTIVASVCSADSSFGPANIPAVRSHLATWERKSVFPANVIAQCYAALSCSTMRDGIGIPVPPSSTSCPATTTNFDNNTSIPLKTDGISCSGTVTDSAPVSDIPSRTASPDGHVGMSTDGASGQGLLTTSTITTTAATNVMMVRDPARQDILRRMEEDRERHKRAREEAWIRRPDESLGAQFDEAWDKSIELTPEDLERINDDTHLWLEICRPPRIFGGDGST